LASSRFAAPLGRIRKIDSEAELAAIEEGVDAVLRSQLLKSAEQEEGGSDTTALIAAAHRIDNLIHHRRTLLLAAGAQAGLHMPSAAFGGGRTPLDGGPEIGRGLLAMNEAGGRGTSYSLAEGPSE
jgi:hypothetical protein